MQSKNLKQVCLPYLTLMFCLVVPVAGSASYTDNCHLVLHNLTRSSVDADLSFENVDTANVNVRVDSGAVHKMMPDVQVQYIKHIRYDGISCRALNFHFPIQIPAKSNTPVHCMTTIEVAKDDKDQCVLIKKA